MVDFALISTMSIKKIRYLLMFNIFFFILLFYYGFCIYYLYLSILILIEIVSYINSENRFSLIKILIYILLISSIMNNLILSFNNSIIIIYFYILGEFYMHDELTNTLNRKLYVKDLKKKNITALISIDLNDLKKINDTYGHSEGDKAIMKLVGIIKNKLEFNMQLYRIGGDEFSIICYDVYKKEIEEFINEIKFELLKTKYSCSIGVAYKEDNISIEEMICLADELMYKDKQLYKNKGR